MAYEIKWTKRAEQGYEKIAKYLEEHWTEREVTNFIIESNQFFELLKLHPRILQPSSNKKNLHRGPITKKGLTTLTYRLLPRKKVIEFVNIRDSRQKPLKDK